MSREVVITTLTLGVVLAVPILWAALGELIAEQSGVINVGIEGVMLIAAIACAIVYYQTGSVTSGLFAAIGSGVSCGLVLGYFYVVRGMDQIVTGLLFNIFAVGFTTALYASQEYLSAALVTPLPKLAIPGLSEIPWLGDILFRQDALVYAALLTVIPVYYLMRGTWFGLSARTASEHPAAAEAAGLNVWRLRVVAVVLGCTLAAVGGATLVISTSGSFVVGITAGRGFIALAVVVLARWNPLALVVTTFLFGLAQSLQSQAQNLTGLKEMPPEFWLTFPYLLTIFAVGFARGSRYPAACGVPYARPGVVSWSERLRLRLLGLHRMRAAEAADATELTD